MDFFQKLELTPQAVQDIVNSFAEKDETYENCQSLVEQLNQVGWTCSYYLDAAPYDLRPNISEVLFENLQAHKEDPEYWYDRGLTEEPSWEFILKDVKLFQEVLESLKIDLKLERETAEDEDGWVALAAQNSADELEKEIKEVESILAQFVLLEMQKEYEGEKLHGFKALEPFEDGYLLKFLRPIVFIPKTLDADLHDEENYIWLAKFK